MPPNSNSGPQNWGKFTSYHTKSEPDPKLLLILYLISSRTPWDAKHSR